MSIASTDQRLTEGSFSASGRIARKSYDIEILVSLAIVATVILIAMYALAGEHGVSPNELGLMTAYP
jgi:uncharacterized membrane protein YhaH (DUF805 family)